MPASVLSAVHWPAEVGRSPAPWLSACYWSAPAVFSQPGGCFAGALIFAQRASVASAPSAPSAPAPGGLLASAPAPGTAGDYTTVSGPYTYIVSPNISVPSFSTSAYSYFSGNGSIASVCSALAHLAFGKVNRLVCGYQPVRQQCPHAETRTAGGSSFACGSPAEGWFCPQHRSKTSRL